MAVDHGGGHGKATRWMETGHSLYSPVAIGVPSVAALTLGGITQDEYDKKARELKGRQNEIALRIGQHQDGEGDYRTTLESLISVASRAADIFKRSKTEQERELIAFVFSNLRLRGKKL